MDIKIRTANTCETSTTPLWDTVWNQEIDGQPFGGYGDWAIAGSVDVEPDNQVGLQATNALHTAIIIQLFSDRRIDNHIDPPDGSSDRRGWHGDGFDIRVDLFEREMGSHLWLLERAAITDPELPLKVEEYAREALQVLIDQGAVVEFEIGATLNSAIGAILLDVEAYGQSKSLIYHQKFERVWQQTR